MGVGVAQAKLLLFGEHAVVHGYPALGLGLPYTLRVEALERAPDWELDGVPVRHRAAVFQVIRLLGGIRSPDLPPSHLRLSGDVPIESGLGSSAALCAALARLFYPTAGALEHWALARQAEHVFHGASSGVDVALALHPGLLLFTPGDPYPELRSLDGPPLTLVIGSLERAARARDLILGLREKARAGAVGVLDRLRCLGEASREALAYLRPTGADVAALGRLAQRARAILDELGLGHPAWPLLESAARRAGSLGGKWSGAGAGGAFWFVFPDEGAARHAAATLGTLDLPWLLAPRAVTPGHRTR
ncbi:MAG: hypothetical protein QN161_12290 [Armatimonadota bacterium]|nr:hypothetical protein [Armatimonadota bacterium]